MTVSFEFTIKFFFFQVGLAQSCVAQQDSSADVTALFDLLQVIRSTD